MKAEELCNYVTSPEIHTFNFYLKRNRKEEAKKTLKLEENIYILLLLLFLFCFKISQIVIDWLAGFFKKKPEIH